MPRFVIAPDSFKESLTAMQACHAMQRGICSVMPQAEYICIPMADGGAGTLDALMQVCKLEKIACQVQGPLPEQQIDSYFALTDAGKTAIIEMAKANGIALLKPEQRNPMLTSTYGTGQMLLHALDLGVDKVIIALGGSVTNDGGSGLAQALGVGFYDKAGQLLHVCGGNLDQIDDIDMTHLDARLRQIEIIIASDVTNPLCGSTGASYIFGPQKGATPAMVEQLDANLAHYARKVSEVVGKDVAGQRGAGAAGGLAFALMAFCGAHMQSGAEFVIQQTGLAQHMQQANYVLTGEGKIDAQTHLGKTPYAVARLAQQFNIPVIAFAGVVGDGIEDLYTQGFHDIVSINPHGITQEQAMQNAALYLEQATAKWLSIAHQEFLLK